MKVPVFFASLLFMLLWGNIHSFAGIELRISSCPSPNHIKKQESIKFNNTSQVWVSVTNHNLPEENNILICEDIEDEDVNDLSPGKCKSVVGFYYIPSRQSCLNVHYDCARALPFFWRQSSRRYILHRTLRI